MLALLSVHRAARVIEQTVVDNRALKPHSQARHERNGKLALADLEHLSNPAPEIDAVWRDRVHTLHFGFGIAPDHDARMPKVLPLTALARDSREYRQHLNDLNRARLDLLKQDTYLYTAGVARLMSAEVEGESSAEVSLFRRWGTVLAVPDHGRWLYPAFQFDETGQPYSEIAEAHQVFGEDNPWEVLSWWYLPLEILDGDSLATVIRTESGRAVFVDALASLRS
jgi:hypothetical protein